MTLLRSLLSAALAVTLSVSAAVATERRVVTFGDSLSDTGNLFALTNGAIPGAPYFEGRFSNGPVWPEILAENAQRGYVEPVDNEADTNFAIGGAWAGKGGEVPDIGVQIADYLRRGGRFGATDVVTLFGGANDLLGLRAPTTPAQAAGEARRAANAMGRHLLRVLRAKAQTVVVLKLPSLDTSPRAASLGPATARLYASATDAFNARLDNRVAVAQRAFPSARIVVVDTEVLFDAVIAAPEPFRFDNTSDPCLSVPACADKPVTVQNGYFFFDDIHPTTRVNEILAAVVEAAIE